MSKRNYPPLEYIKECLREENGKLFWKERPVKHFNSEKRYRRYNATRLGNEAGCISIDGNGHPRCFISITHNKKEYTLKRSIIIWSFYNNSWIECGFFVDHKDLNTTNDQIDNLRKATNQQNQGNRNKPKTNKSGYKGVCKTSYNNKYRAHIKVNGIDIHLGTFNTPEEAYESYKHASQIHYGEFSRTQ